MGNRELKGLTVLIEAQVSTMMVIMKDHGCFCVRR
jgi:hypothetical protein